MVRAPSLLGITCTPLRSQMAMHEYVVPRSNPIHAIVTRSRSHSMQCIEISIRSLVVWESEREAAAPLQRTSNKQLPQLLTTKALTVPNPVAHR